MKDSGIKWIGKIPAHWKVGKIKYVASFTKGKIPAHTNRDGIGVPYIGATEMIKKSFSIYTDDRDLPVCQPNDLLILWDGANAGIVANGLSGVVSSTVVKVSLTDKKIDSQYFYYLLKYAETYFRDKVGGTTIPHMNSSYIDDIPLLMFSQKEQKAIADYLDEKCGKIDELIRLKEQKIQSLKEYKKSLIYEYVTGKKRVG